MLKLNLTLTNHQVNVRANGKESHQFSRSDLDQSAWELKDFYKNPRIYGEKLFDALFKDAARVEFDALSKQAERTIVLVLESPELDSIAWEYAYNKVEKEYVVEDCAFVRTLPEKERPAKRNLNEVERVPLLFIPANPLVDLKGEPMHALNIEKEWERIETAITDSDAPFDMRQLRPPTMENLQWLMAKSQLIVHFSGHGGMKNGEAHLLFEFENGASDWRAAREFVREIKDKAWIGFLSACQSAVPEQTRFSNLARELAKAGVPFALGMQFNLPDAFAPNISGQFYNYLAHGHAVPESARQARRAVKRENEFFVGMIALYAAHPDEVGKLSWRGEGVKTEPVPSANVDDLLPSSPASGLIGRQRELMRIGTRLLEGKKPLTVTLHGAGGIGKTALLWQALLRFAPSFELTLAIGLDPLPSLESVLGRIEKFLGLPIPCSNDTKERETLVRNALTSKRTLLGLDNFETLNHALNDDATKGTAKSLYAFFKGLPAEGVTFCVTNREKTNLPGENIEIYGLEDAMGGTLFYKNVNMRKDALNEAGLEKLSAAVGGHPLALRLLAPIFEEQAGLSLEQFVEKLQIFLPKASDQLTEQQRHESLGACLAFSIDNLPKNEKGERLRVAIDRLSIFVSFFVDLTATQVLENRFLKNEEFGEALTRVSSTLHNLWERSILEIRKHPIGDGVFYTYRFHPALRQIVVERTGLENNASTQEIYWFTMRRLTSLAYPAHTGGGIYADPTLSTIVMEALPDLINATNIKPANDRESLTLLFHTAFFLDHFGEIEMAGQLLKSALEARNKLNDLELKSTILHLFSHTYLKKGEVQQTRNYLYQALEIDDMRGDLAAKSATFQALASTHALQSEFAEALKFLNQALAIQEKLVNPIGLPNILQAIAAINIRLDKYDEALDLLSRAADALKSRKNYKSQIAVLLETSTVYRKLGKLDQALQNCLEADELAEQIHEVEFKPNILHEIGKIYYDRDELDEALAYYYRALELDKFLGDIQGQSAVMHGIANIYTDRKEYDNAIGFYSQSIEIDKQLNDKQGMAMSLMGLGESLWRKEQYEDGLRKFLDGFSMLLAIEIQPVEMIGTLLEWKKQIGDEPFRRLWLKVSGRNLPEWLSKPSYQQEQEITMLFISKAIQSAREKRSEAEQYFMYAQKMATDSSISAELRELGRVLSRIMAEDIKADLSGLRDEWRDAVEKALNA